MKYDRYAIAQIKIFLTTANTILTTKELNKLNNRNLTYKTRNLKKKRSIFI